MSAQEDSNSPPEISKTLVEPVGLDGKPFFVTLVRRMTDRSDMFNGCIGRFRGGVRFLINRPQYRRRLRMIYHIFSQLVEMPATELAKVFVTRK